MSAKWTVRKRDGVWQAFDWEGKSRYASRDWFNVLSFALMGYYEETRQQHVARVVKRWFGE